jgi:hypothetical protein
MRSGTQGLSDRARRGNIPFHNEMATSLVLLSETQGPSDRTRTGNIPFPIVFTALDFLVGVDSTPVFSRFNLHQAANRNPPKTASTFRHAGWMVVTECRSHSRDTGPFRGKRQSVDPLNIQAVSPNRRTKHVRQTRQKQWSRSTRRISEAHVPIESDCRRGKLVLTGL